MHSALGLDAAAGVRVLVASHTCDLQDPSIEPEVLVVIGKAAAKRDGGIRFAKSIRLLQLESADGKRATFDIRQLRFLDASILTGAKPWAAEVYPESERRILRQWLAQRFHREAYPDDFVRCLMNARLIEKMRERLRDSGDTVREVRFALDRTARPSGPYRLVIVPIYNTATDPDGSACDVLAQQIGSDFADAQASLVGVIELRGVAAQPDAEISYRTVRDETTAWRLDDLSLRDDGDDPPPPA